MHVCTASEPWYVGEGLDPPGVPVLRYSQSKANPQKLFAFCEFALFFSLIQVVLRGRGRPLPYGKLEQSKTGERVLTCKAAQFEPNDHIQMEQK